MAATVLSLRNHLRASARDVLIEAAEHIASTEGLPKVSLQAIAQRAGIAVGTIYNYFEDRQDLFDELFARRREELYAAIDDAAKHSARAPFEVQLDAFVRTVFAFFDARRAFLRVALEAENERPAIVRDKKGKPRSTMVQLQTRAEKVVGVGLREKRLRDRPTTWFASILVAIVRGVLVNEASDDAPLVRETEGVIDVFLHGAAR
jgi:AcrR family transcriptional regulator